MITLRSIEGFHVGGRIETVQGAKVELRRLAQGGRAREIDPNGDHVTGQMYVQAFRLAAPRSPFPLVLWHGGGMTGANWDGTPDGRPGWLTRFLEAGFDVLVCDATERGRASWSPYPEIYETGPLFRTMNEAWDMFRIGPASGYATEPSARVAHGGSQFPVGHFDQFAKQFVPRWAEHDELILLAYRALINKVGPCILLGHSQGGGFALRAAQEAAGQVRAVVALEPSGAPPPAAGHACPPHLVVWGDNTESHPIWSRYRAAVEAYLASLPQGRAETVDLPQEAVRGNSHFLMLDRNSDWIASRVAAWLVNVAGC